MWSETELLAVSAHVARHDSWVALVLNTQHVQWYTARAVNIREAAGNILAHVLDYCCCIHVVHMCFWSYRNIRI